MDNKISKLIEDLIVECECDNRIVTGIFDIYDTEHLVVLSEHMASRGISDSVIESAIESMVDEGKYPERQAYNKEGWLVTFPSKEYRDAAIKKRTHYTSDPTHGKGGMNLYYKRKGKQKRQTAQDLTTTDAQQPQRTPLQKPQEPTVSDATPRTPEEQEKIEKAKNASTSAMDKNDGGSTKYPDSKENKPTPKDQTQSVDSGPSDSGSEPSGQSAPVPAIDVPVVTQPSEQYASISKKFVAQKGWTPTEYGEYRDADGNPIAVVGLSGEIVPIRTNDREEYKIFAEKLKS